MNQSKTKYPRRRRRRVQARRGAWFGRIVFLTFGIVGTMFYMEVREVGFEAAVQNLQARFASKPIEAQPLPNPLTGGRVVEAVDADTRPLHEQDSRWNTAIALGEEGVKQREDALYEHYEGEGGGDPFILRDQSQQAFDKISAALVDLRAMREEYARSKSSRMQLDFQIERFAKIVEGMHEKNNRH